MMGELERYKLHLVNLERSQRTIDGYIGDLVFFMNWLECDLGGSLLIGHITPDDLNRFLLLLKTERDYKPASRRRVAEALKGFFAWAYSQGYIAHSGVDHDAVQEFLIIPETLESNLLGLALP